MTSLRIGDPVQVHETSEVLTLVCLDNGRAWCRDGAGNHLDYPEEDLVRARSTVYRETIEASRQAAAEWRRSSSTAADYLEGWELRPMRWRS